MNFKNKNRLEKLEAKNNISKLKPLVIRQFYDPDYIPNESDYWPDETPRLPWELEQDDEDKSLVSHGGKMRIYPPLKKDVSP